MKITLLSILFFLSVNSFSQKVTYKDLIGTSWVGINNSGILGTPYMKFIDSNNIHFEMNFETQPFAYKLDTTSNPTTLLLIEYIPGNGKTYTVTTFIKRIFIKITDANTLKIQFVGKSKKWNIKEPIKYTYIYHKDNNYKALKN